MNEQEVKTELEGIRVATLEAINKQRDDWKKFHDEAKAAGADGAEVKLQLERAMKRLDGVEATLRAPIGSTLSPFSVKSLGQMVAESDATKELSSRISRDGTGYVRGTNARIPIKSFFLGALDESKTTITSSAVGSSTPGILVPSRIPGIVKPGVRRVRVRDLVPRFTTSSNSVEYVKENVFTNNASPQVEASAKEESALTFTIDYANVKTLAHWIPATKQILSDFAGLQAYIDQRLLEGLKDEEDTQLLTGDNTGQNLRGLSGEATAYDTGLNETGDTQIDKVSNAMGQIEAVNLTPDGVILHPTDWRKMNKIKDQASGVGNYVMGGPANMGAPTLWGLPVAVTTAVVAGTFYVGAFQQYSAIWDREDATVEISTEHSDYFTKNLVAIRAEERLAAAWYRGDAFVYGSF